MKMGTLTVIFGGCAEIATYDKVVLFSSTVRKASIRLKLCWNTLTLPSNFQYGSDAGNATVAHPNGSRRMYVVKVSWIICDLDWARTSAPTVLNFAISTCQSGASLTMVAMTNAGCNATNKLS